jgi:hypothetical protein
MCLLAQTDYLYQLVRKINIASATVTTLAGQRGISTPYLNGVGSDATFSYPVGIALDSAGDIAVVVSTVRCRDDALRQQDYCDLYVTLQADRNNFLIRAINVNSGEVTTIAGQQGVSMPYSDGVGQEATFSLPNGVALNSEGTLVFVVSCKHLSC